MKTRLSRRINICGGDDFRTVQRDECLHWVIRVHFGISGIERSFNKIERVNEFGCVLNESTP